MDYSALLKRSWDIVWNNKWLILLGVLVALGSGAGGSGSSGGGGNFSFPDNSNLNSNDNFDFETQPDLSEEEFAALAGLMGLGIGVFIAIMCVAFVVGLIFFVVSRVATGGLIAAVDVLDGGGEMTFGRAWSAGWARGWTLICNGIIGLLPGLAFAIIVLVLLFTTLGIGAGTDFDSLDESAVFAAFAGIGVVVLTLACVFIPLFIVFGILLLFADRAAMIEGLGVFDSYGRAWNVLKENFGQVALVVLISIAINLALGFVLIGPTFAIILCCILWPLLWVINGAIQAYFSTMWTLAYRQWIGRGQITPLTGPAADVPPPAPAV